MQILLQDDGFEVIITTDGRKVKTLCKQNPDLIFLDIWMSGMDGKIICKELKSDPSTRGIPVVLFSANRDTKEIATECGADYFILKPFEITDMLTLARKYTQ